MALRSRRTYLGFFSSLNNITRYNSILSSSFSTLEHFTNTSIHNQSQNHLNERFVLDELTNLLSTNPQTLTYNQFTEPTPKPSVMETRVSVDQFLTPAEKLRGIFLQKLKGKAAIESALTNVGVDLTMEIVGEVLNRGNLGGEAMVLFFNWAIKRPEMMGDCCESDVYCAILKALGRRKFFDSMDGVLVEMRKKGVGLNLDMLGVVMDSLVRARRVAKVFKLFGKLEEFGVRADTDSFNVLLKCLCRRSHIGKASSFLKVMKGKIAFDCATYNVIIGGWAKVGRVNEVEECLEAVVADGFSPDCLTFSYLIECLGRAGRVGDAIEVFEKMREKGCVPDVVVYNAVISNFVSVGELDECMKYYLDMIEKDCVPNTDTYTILISAFIMDRRVADSLELFDEMIDRGIIPSTGTVTSFLEPLCSFGPPHAAMVIYKKARKVGCRISLKAYKLLLMRLSRFGKCGMVLQVWDEMQSCGYSSDVEVYEYVVNGLCNIGQLDSAILVMEEALNKGFCPGKIIYSKLNNKLLNCYKVDKAYKLFLKVKEARRFDNARKYWRANGWHF